MGGTKPELFGLGLFAGGVTWVPVKADPDWSLWQGLPKVELWEAVVLSLDFNPATWDQVLESGHSHEAIVEEFQKRLRSARAHLGEGIHPYSAMNKDDPERTEVRLNEFVNWARGLGWDLPEAMPLDVAGRPPLVAPPQKMREQEKAILCALREEGFDPQRLPKSKGGKAGPKKAVRDKLKVGKHGGSSLFTPTAFDRAWERLRSNEDIKDAD